MYNLSNVYFFTQSPQRSWTCDHGKLTSERCGEKIGLCGIVKQLLVQKSRKVCNIYVPLNDRSLGSSVMEPKHHPSDSSKSNASEPNALKVSTARGTKVHDDDSCWYF